ASAAHSSAGGSPSRSSSRSRTARSHAPSRHSVAAEPRRPDRRLCVQSPRHAAPAKHRLYWRASSNARGGAAGTTYPSRAIGPRVAASQCPELVDQATEVDGRVAVEEADDAVVAVDLLEHAVRVYALEEGTCADLPGQPVDQCVSLRGDQVLGDRGHHAQLS